MTQPHLAETLDRLSPGEAAGWAAAGLVVLGLHAAGFWFAQNAAEEPSGAPVEAVMIELAPMPVAPEPVAEPVPEPIVEEIAPPVEPEPVEKVVEAEPIEVPEPPAETQELLKTPPEIETPPEVVEAEPIQLPEPPLATRQLDTPPVIEPEIVEAVTPEVDIPLPRPRPEPPKREVAEKAPPKRTRKAQPQKPAAPPPRQQQQAARAEKPAAPKAQQPAERRTSRVSPARWQARLQSYLNRHKRYPSGARSRREEGTVQLSFSIDASGRVLSAKVARSSGYPELDAEVLAMVRRASPLPAPPAEIAEARMRISVPVSFSLR